MSEAIYFGTDELRMAAGKFRTSRRYIRAGTTSPVFAIAKGRTMDLIYSSTSGLEAYRYSVDGYVQSYARASTSSSFNATVQKVKI